MALNKSIVSGLGVSLGIHVVVLLSLSFIVYDIGGEQLQMVVDSVFAEERAQEEFSQEIEQDNEVADSMNVIAGGAITSAIGGSGAPAVAQTKIEQAESLKEPEIKVNVGAITAPGLNTLGNDLGAGEVTGDIGQVVEGYGAAMSQFTQELVRLMRDQRVLVVWAFDESESMKPAQKEVREKFGKIYEELGIAAKQDQKLKASDEVLLTVVTSYGQGLKEQTAKPTANISEIRAAIDKIDIDRTGKENMCQTINAVVGKYLKMAQSQKRKLVVCVVTDESGDDGEAVEDTIALCKRGDVPVYFLGQYAAFGYPYARYRWVDPQYGLTHWLEIHQGPETPMPELLQFDGIGPRWNYMSSGFGPYEQVRIARETGGVYYLLPSYGTNLVTSTKLDDRKYELLDMREYLPVLSARMPYVKERDASKFRSAQWEVISLLNPHQDAKLRMREHWYPTDPVKFAEEGKRNFEMAIRAMGLLNQASAVLEKIKPLEAKEQSQRWRANYELTYAQCLAYRVRLFQFLLALDQHQKAKPMPKGSTKGQANNAWNLARVQEMLPPDPEQLKITKIDMNELNQQLEKAKAMFAQIVKDHPNTPWARRAQDEMNSGYGMKFIEVYRDPRYDNKDIKLPAL